MLSGTSALPTVKFVSKNENNSITLWTSCWRQILRFGLGSYFHKYTSKGGSTDLADNMEVNFKVTCVTR
jgi:hypothetical protein